uniref:RING-type domain-containing protein n=1 Tax=Ciona intestinalis TaxID=7719 RepID=F6Y8I1_CIOIN
YFFTGPGDLVKCWYCGNKLKNFDVEDEPWMEHAKWFPQCEFLLQNKGHAFVANIQTSYPRNVHVVNLPSVESGPTFLPSPIQNHETLATQQRQLLEEGMTQDYVQQAVEIFGLVAVERVMKRLIESSGCYYQTSEGLINAVLESSETTTTTTTTTNTQDTSTPTQSGHYFFPVDSDVRIPVQRTNFIQPSIPMHGTDNSDNISSGQSNSNSQLCCKVCLNRDATIAFNPCGHLCVCQSCSPRLNACPICRRSIQQKIRIYFP